MKRLISFVMLVSISMLLITSFERSEIDGGIGQSEDNSFSITIQSDPKPGGD